MMVVSQAFDDSDYATITGTSHMDMDLMEMTEYTYQVMAVNSVGASMASDADRIGHHRPDERRSHGSRHDCCGNGNGRHDVRRDGRVHVLHDADPEDATLTYTAMSDMTQYATASVSGSMVTINGVAAGSATITVTATDSMAHMPCRPSWLRWKRRLRLSWARPPT